MGVECRKSDSEKDAQEHETSVHFLIIGMIEGSIPTVFVMLAS